jgi:hypothetical protein
MYVDKFFRGKNVFNAFLIFCILKILIWDKKRLNHPFACG